MEYVDIIKRISEIEQEDFTMERLKEAGNIAQEIFYVYGKELMRKKEDAKVRMMNVKDLLNCVVFNKLKEKTGFENEIIDDLVGFIGFFNQVSDIYILDGNIIVKLTTPDEKETSYVRSNELMDISGKDFTRGLDYELYKCFYVEAMNKAMVPLFKEKFDKGNLLNINSDLHISYNLDNLSIYSNKTLKELMQINTDVSKDVAKVLIKHNHDEFYYFDLKIHYAYFELAHNEYKVNKLSEMLNKKDKVKKK